MKLSNLLSVLFVIFVFASCDNEDVDDIGQITAVDLIAEESNLFSLLDRVVTNDPDALEITCIDFVYSFVVVVYDADLEIVSSVVVSNNQGFSSLLSGVAEDHFINLSFPITSTLENGTSFEINNKAELEMSINDCKEEQELQIIGQCTNLLLDCVWEIALPDDILFSTYTDAVFDNDSDGTTDLFYRGVVYNGTWTVYFIEDELHVNINLQGEGDVQTDWNFDWKTEILSNNMMSIRNDDGDAFLFSKECETENYCKTLDFESCIVDGTATFTLSDYDECVIIIAAPQQTVDETTGEVSDLVAWEITYYETQIDADTSTNVLINEFVFTAAAGQQIIFARIENPTTEEFTTVPVNLLPEDCE